LFFSKINQHSWKKQFAGQIRLFIIKKNFNSADRIKFVSQALYDQYSRYLNLKPHAFKTKVFCNYYSTHHMRKSDNHDNFILVIGHPYYIKGIDILIRAFNQISADYPGIRLKVIGHCEDLSPYHKLVAEHSTVEFQKGVPFDQIISELEKCMFFVLPSRTEGLPRVVVEAMASGKAVIGSRVGGIPEVVEENKTGLLFESENYQELAKKMRLFLDDEEFMHRMGKAGHERARIHFSPERYVHRYHEFLENDTMNSENIRIMQVIYCFEIGGSESVARDIALNMRKNCVHGVGALEYDGPLRLVFEANNIPTFLINKIPGDRLIPMIRIWRAMKRFRPDVVHTHHLYELFYALPGALLTGAKIIHTEHEYYSLMSSRARFLLRQLSRFCRAVTGVNKETAAFLRNNIGIPAKKVHTVVNGMDLDRYRTNKVSRTEIGLTDDDLVAGIVARLHPVKDHLSLLMAFRLVVDHQPKAKLMIIGNGPERGHLEQKSHQLGLDRNVHFLGTRFDVPDLLNCMDVFVLSSREEGLPLCILEAMAAGRPVVATEVGGIPSVVKSGETGFLVPPGDTQAMARVLLKMFNDPVSGTMMGINGRRLIEQQFDLKKSINKYFQLYQDAMN
jgi:sugar transferase (PEP-CTERM/EpsH1 system associated)